MNKDGIYGDQITLQAASNIFSVQITVHSSLRLETTTMVSPLTQVGYKFNLGHFGEGQGQHYVYLEVEENCCVKTVQVTCKITRKYWMKMKREK